MKFDLIALKSVDLFDLTGLPTGPISANILLLNFFIVGFNEVFLLPNRVYLIPLILL